MSNKIPPDFSEKFSQGFDVRLREAIVKSYGPRGLAEFCRRTGMPRRTIENYLAGRTVPDMKTLERIVPHLGVSPVWLVFGTTRPRVFVAESFTPYSTRLELVEMEKLLRGALAKLGTVRETLDEGGMGKQRKS